LGVYRDPHQRIRSGLPRHGLLRLHPPPPAPDSPARGAHRELHPGNLVQPG
jgi:hypothetical protein